MGRLALQALRANAGRDNFKKIMRAALAAA
jgi:hypothetical protein